MNSLIQLDFGSEADLFLARYQPKEVHGKKLGNKNTYELYKRGLTRLLEFMVANSIHSINNVKLAQLNVLQNDFLKEYSAKTTQVYLGVIKEFFYFLQNRGVLHSNDFSLLRIVSINKREQKTTVLNNKEATKVMAYVMSLETSPLTIIDKMIFLIILNTGIREEEITHIKLKDIVKQGKNLIIQIQGKGMRKRYVALSSEVSKKLNVLKLQLENAIMSPLESNDYLIQSMSNNFNGKNKKPIHRVSISNRVRKISDNMKLYFTTHSLRRTFATILYQNSTPIESIQRILGHENVTTTQGYIDLHIDKEVGIKHATSMVG